MQEAVVRQEPTVPLAKPVDDIKRHVVQLESLVLFVVLLQGVLLIQPIILTILKTLAIFLTLMLLALVPTLVRVTNPESETRSRLAFGLSGAGFGGSIGGAIAGFFSFGVGAPAGVLIGAPLGFVFGAVAGPYIDGTKKDPASEVLTQGQAREYLIKMRKRYPDLAVEKIVDATAYPPASYDCAVYMFTSDGVVKCTRQALDEWLVSRCWR
jgi:hypothetical protein